jgi:hypothetical protein
MFLTFAAGTGHAASDEITLSDGTVVTVAAVSTGAVTEFDITTSSTSGQGSDGATLTQSGTTGSGIGFSLTLDTANQAVRSANYVGGEEGDGNYSVLPSNPVSTTGSTDGNDNATFTIGWGVSEVEVTDGGNNYTSAPAVSFSGGGGAGAAATAVLDGDEVDSVTASQSRLLAPVTQECQQSLSHPHDPSLRRV